MQQADGQPWVLGEGASGSVCIYPYEPLQSPLNRNALGGP
jgi:hypothetical protein